MLSLEPPEVGAPITAARQGNFPNQAHTHVTKQLRDYYPPSGPVRRADGSKHRKNRTIGKSRTALSALNLFQRCHVVNHFVRQDGYNMPRKQFSHITHSSISWQLCFHTLHGVCHASGLVVPPSRLCTAPSARRIRARSVANRESCGCISAHSMPTPTVSKCCRTWYSKHGDRRGDRVRLPRILGQGGARNKGRLPRWSQARESPPRQPENRFGFSAGTALRMFRPTNCFGLQLQPRIMPCGGGAAADAPPHRKQQAPPARPECPVRAPPTHHPNLLRRLPPRRR
jgi:hypothetical protein